MENASILPATIADVWTAVSGFFTTGLSILFDEKGNVAGINPANK